MSDLQIGSQEWRWDPPRAIHGVVPAWYLATRCGLSAPGRSAGSCSLRQWGDGDWIWVTKFSDHVCETRAEAAAASYRATVEHGPNCVFVGGPAPTGCNCGLWAMEL